MFERGFLVTTSGNVGMEEWEKIKLTGLNAWAHPLLDYHKHKKDNVTLVVFGKIIDPFNNNGDVNEITESLAKKFAYSEDQFFEYLDELSGRFVIVLESENKTYILQDAAGNKSLFYNSQFNLFSSHSELIAQLSNQDWHEDSKECISDSMFHKRGSHFPGRMTTYKNVLKSIPNTLIDVRAGAVRRFFPREPLAQNIINHDIIDEISNVLRTQIKLLRENHSLAQSLTAGLDSRVTLAASKEFSDEIYYYTISAWEEHEKEIQVVQKLCDVLGIKHEVLREKRRNNPGFYEDYLKSNSYMSSKERGQLVKILLEHYPKDYLHLKSSLSEIGRAFYYEHRTFLPSMPGAEDLAKLYGYNSRSHFVVHAFRDLIEKTAFDKESIFNYNPYDLHYWEYRMGSWQSQGLMECDVAQDSIILFNNRRLLKLMLSVPFADRRKSALHYALIKNMWPEALSIDINPWATKNTAQDLKRIARGLIFRFL